MEYIDIKGVDYPVNVGNLFYYKIEELLDKPFTEINFGGVRVLSTVLYCALLDGGKATGKVVRWKSVEDMIADLPSMNSKEYHQIMEDMSAILIKQLPKAEEGEK